MASGGWNKGIPHTPEAIAKMRASKKGKPSTFKGRKHSDESIEKQRMAKLGKKASAETRARVRLARIGRVPWNKGISQTTECNLKNSISNTGRHPTAETCAKISLALRKRIGDTHFDRCLRAYYGITEAEYNATLARQNGVCALCGKPNSNNRKLCVDHDHFTNRVRGLLCDKCNRGLGYLGDTYEKLNSAAEYLKRSIVI